MPRSPGSPTASTPAAASEFVEALGKTIGDRSLTIFEGGTPSPLALAAAENAAAKMTVKVLRTDNSVARRHRARARRQGLADRRGALWLCADATRDRGRVRSSGRTAQRHFAAGDIRRALGGRGATARQALAPPRHRHRQRRNQRHRAAAAGLDLLSDPRARALRRRAARRQGRRPAAGADAIPRPEAADDRDGRRRHARRRKSATGSRPGWIRAACWCASPARGWRKATTISCR